MRQEVPRLVHQLDRERLIGNPDVNVQTKNQERSRQLLQLVDDVLVALARGENLVRPVRKRVRPGGCDTQADPFGGISETTP